MAYCSLTFNGVLIDQAIDGYTTINVSGRGLLNRVVSSVDIPGRDGSHVLESRLGARRITVYYILKAPDSKTFLERMQQLHDLLSSDSDVKFKFGDEDYHRFGRLINASDPPRDQLEGQGSFVLLCADPYRYMDEQVVGLSPVSAGFELATTPTSIKVTLASAATQIKITNTTTGANIVLDGTYASGDVITLTWDRVSPTIKRGLGEDILSHLDILSDFETFRFKTGDSIAVTPASSSVVMRACKKGR